METFVYTALTSAGKTTRGVMQGENAKQVRQLLRGQQLLPLTIAVAAPEKTSGQRYLSARRRLQAQELTLFTRQFATLIAAKLPIEEALQGIAEQSERPLLKQVVLRVRQAVLEGHSLAQALAQFPQIFSELYRATISAGEHTGKLDVILNRLADYVEQQQAMRQKVLQALIYPALMSCVAIAVVSFLLAYVVPNIVGVFQDSHQTLPATTRLLIAISQVVRHAGLYVIALFALAWYGVRLTMRRQPALRIKWQRLLLQIPWLGYSIRTLNTARYARTLGILAAAGVAILEAMRIAATLVTSLPIRDAVTAAANKVSEGSSIHLSLKQAGYFAPLVLHLIASGEGSGQLDQMLERAALIQERDVTRLIETGVTLFEPLIILLMGGIVLFIVLAILLPIFQLDQFIG
jgi:general secretion pathway protein F